MEPGVDVGSTSQMISGRPSHRCQYLVAAPDVPTMTSTRQFQLGVLQRGGGRHARDEEFVKPDGYPVSDCVVDRKKRRHDEAGAGPHETLSDAERSFVTYCTGGRAAAQGKKDQMRPRQIQALQIAPRKYGRVPEGIPSQHQRRGVHGPLGFVKETDGTGRGECTIEMP